MTSRSAEPFLGEFADIEALTWRMELIRWNPEHPKCKADGRELTAQADFARLIHAEAMKYARFS